MQTCAHTAHARTHGPILGCGDKGRCRTRLGSVAGVLGVVGDPARYSCVGFCAHRAHDCCPFHRSSSARAPSSGCRRTPPDRRARTAPQRMERVKRASHRRPSAAYPEGKRVGQQLGQLGGHGSGTARACPPAIFSKQSAAAAAAMNRSATSEVDRQLAGRARRGGPADAAPLSRGVHAHAEGQSSCVRT
jgi:hypothetical protein